ncbi:MAG: hypothetical protein ACFE0K_04260 [Alcanivorax sp.]|uniref:hypothetical protein n=1 Tax=Alcanivorax sp. TaxID=1872427 RepID=UPI003DA77C54
MFDAEKSFFSLSVVRRSAAFLIGVAIASAATIYFGSDLEINLSYHGFNKLIEVYRFPLGVLALLIPIIAVLGVNHRSEQTRVQIKITSSQNNFSNHFKHLEEFIKYYDSHLDGMVTDLSPRELHFHLFPRSRNGDYTIHEDISESIETCFYCIKKAAMPLASEKVTISDINEVANNISNYLSGIEGVIGARLPYPFLMDLEGKEKSLFEKYTNYYQDRSRTKWTIVVCIARARLIRAMLAFSEESLNEEMAHFCNINDSLIPEYFIDDESTLPGFNLLNLKERQC